MYFNTLGGYSKEINVIYILPNNLSVYTVLNSAGHETGHYVYFNKLTQTERDEYKKIFLSSTQFVTDYARTNEFEDFAEMFNHMGRCELSPKYLDTEDPAKLKFFENHFLEMIQ
jgi:hypothetical protein